MKGRVAVGRKYLLWNYIILDLSPVLAQTARVNLFVYSDNDRCPEARTIEGLSTVMVRETMALLSTVSAVLSSSEHPSTPPSRF